MRSDRSNRYTAVPQAVSDEDEGVYDESPESSQHAELLSMENLSTVADTAIGEEGPVKKSEVRTFEFYRPAGHKPQLPLALVDASPKRHSKMSRSRKFCFVLSICISIAYMVALLWLIPCNLAPCVPRTNHQILPLHFEEWNRTFANLRFISDPQPVKVGSDGKAVLLLAFRLIDLNASVTNVVGKSTEELIGGVIAIEGETGNESWRHYFYTDVLGIVCSIADVDQNGVLECAIVGSTGLLAAINASNGYIFWYLHDHNDQSVQISAISAPCPFPGVDLDQDGVDDLAVVGLLTYKGHRKRRSGWLPPEQYVPEQVFHLLLVSGGTGQVIGQPVILPISPPAHSYFHGYNRLPALFLYELETNSKSLLVFWGNGDGSFSDLHNNPGIILMALLEQVYANATRHALVNDDTVDVVYKDIYRGTGNLQSVSIVESGSVRARELVVLGSNAGELVCLSESNGFLSKWFYKVENGFKISQPAFGNYNKDDNLDVFVTIRCVNCSSNADECSSKAVVINGRDGQELTSSLTDCMALKPFVVYGTEPNTSDLFLFEITADEQGGDVITEKTSSEVPQGNLSLGFDHLNGSSAFIRFDAYPTRPDKANIWNDIRNYGIEANFKVPPNDSLLGEIERMELDKAYAEDTTATPMINSKQNYVEKTYVGARYSLGLRWLPHSEVYQKDILLYHVRSCCMQMKAPVLDTVLQGRGIVWPYFINIEERSFEMVVTCLKLDLRPKPMKFNHSITQVIT